MKLDGIRQKVFLDRYALKDKTGAPLEKTPEEMWKRISKAVAKVEKKEKQKIWEQTFYEAMEDFKFVPGGRVLAGAGTGYDVTFYNCYVLPSPKDSRDGILDNLKSMIEIMARGGGVGINISSLRPRGARVKKVNGFSSGPCNWAEMYSLATHDIIQQGGCFAPDARIMTHKGLIPISEIVEGKNNYFAATHKGYKKITAKFNNGLKDVYEVTTNAGLKVKVTDEHKFLTFNNNGEFYLKKLSNFKKGEDLVLLLGEWSNDLPYVSLNHALPLASKYSYGLKDIILPKELNEDLAFILGSYDSDGSKIPDEYSKNGKGIRIAVADDRPQDLKTLMSALKRCFGVTPTTKKGDGAVTIIQVFSRKVNEFLKLNNLLKEFSINVRVPEQIFTSPKSVVAAYVAGVFMGDGSNRGGKGGLRITTVSENFAQELQLLLLNLSIPSKIKLQQRQERSWRSLYTVTVNGATFMQKFLRLLAPYTEKVLDHKPSIRNGFFGWPFNMVERFLYLSNYQRTCARTNPTTSQKSVMFLQHMASSTLKEVDKSDVEFLGGCIPDKISAIEYIGKENVYDLEVEEVHLLSGNGFYTSNSRRGALMLMLWDWHPDIEEFITVKQDLKRINGANLSVAVSDKFMEAVKKDLDWDLVFPDMDDPNYDEKWDGILDNWKKLGKKVKVYKTVKAKKIWDLICDAAWRSAEPGLVFMERYNKWYNNWYWNTINCVNPCGEEGLPAWGVCNLASLNLSAFVKGYSIDKPGKMDYKSLYKYAKIAARFQDDVVDADKYFFKEIEERQLRGERRIGLGTLGLADALIKMHLRYGSKESLKEIDKIFKIIRDGAYEASVEIAREKGAFPKINIKKHLQGYFIKRLPKKTRDLMKKYGVRNSMILQEAPTGTTSLLAGASSGIEPVYEFEFIRRGKLGEHIMYHPLFEEWKKAHPSTNSTSNVAEAGQAQKKPDYFVSANELTPEDHVKVQATIQQYVDASISKTVNAPKIHTIDDVKKLYMLAYDLGCKGITYMRDGSREGVLARMESSASSDQIKEEEVKQEKPLTVDKPVAPRPMQLEGVTYQIDTPVGKTYITINHNEKKEPFEVFITIGKSGSDVAAMADALGRMISVALRLNGTLSPRERIRQIVSQLAGIGGARTVGFGKEKIRSLPDAIAKVLARHFEFAVNGHVEDKKVLSNGNGHTNETSLNGSGVKNGEIVILQQLAIDGSSTGAVLSADVSTTNLFDLCPECGAGSLAYEEGCQKCYSCGYSAC